VRRKTDTAYIVETGLVCAEEIRHCLYSAEWAGVCGGKQTLIIVWSVDWCVQRKADTSYIVETGLVCAEENRHCLYSGHWTNVCGGKQTLLV
jgi:hypothetical protein